MIKKLLFIFMLTIIVVVNIAALIMPDILTEINTTRAGISINNVVIDNDLSCFAYTRAVDIIKNNNTLSHDNWLAHVPKKLRAKYYFGEILAKGSGQYPAEAYIEAWMNSCSHKLVIINPRYTDIGIAVVPSDGYYIVVAIFGIRKH